MRHRVKFTSAHNYRPFAEVSGMAPGGIGNNKLRWSTKQLSAHLISLALGRYFRIILLNCEFSSSSERPEWPSIAVIEL